MTPVSIPFDPAAPRQQLLLDLAPDGVPVRLLMELQYLPGPGRWFLSLSDFVSGEALVRRVPLVASYRAVNDLLFPFRARVPGTLFLMPVPNTPSTADPGRDNLGEFMLIWSDRHA